MSYFLKLMILSFIGNQNQIYGYSYVLELFKWFRSVTIVWIRFMVSIVEMMLKQLIQVHPFPENVPLPLRPIYPGFSTPDIIRFVY